MKYMLDANICICIIKHKAESVLQKFKTLTNLDVCISSVVLAELQYGVSKSRMPEKNQKALDKFLSGIAVLSFDSNAAKHYGDIRANLKKLGTPIGMNDLLIAAHARSSNLILITNNVKEFFRVDNLKVENWA